MILNPLNWSAGPFLALQIPLTVLVLIGIALARRSLGRPPGKNNAPEAGELNMLELAYLSRGRQHVADTILVGFLAAGAAVMNVLGKSKSPEIRVDARSARLPPPLERFRSAVFGLVTRKQFRDAIAPQADDLRRDLVARGLAPSLSDIANYRRLVFMLVAIPLMIGGLKIWVGLDRGRPVGFLIFLVVVTAMLAIGAISNAPFSTRAGLAAVRKSRQQHARAARAPLGPEIALAFALTGAAVLTGTPYAAFGKQVSDSGGGCGGGGDGGGGGGCGGCS